MKSLQSLNNNLSNVIVVGLIVAALKKTIGFEANNAADLLALRGCVAMLTLNAWLIEATAPTRGRSAQVSIKTQSQTYNASQ